MKKFFYAILISLFVISLNSCVTVQTKSNPGKHKGWYKNEKNPHNPNYKEDNDDKKAEKHGKKKGKKGKKDRK